MNLLHPSTVLKQEWTDLIRSNAIKAEKERRLTKKQLELAYSQDWFKILAPTAYGGKQKSIVEVVQLIEALAWAEGSMGWVIGLSAIAGWQAAFMNQEVAQMLLSDEKSAISCTRAESGTAEILEDGYLVNGQWQHASGTIDATSVLGNCIVTRSGQPLLDENGKPQIISIPFLKNEINLLSTWKSMGMLATSSDGFEVRGVKVPLNRSFKTGVDQRTNGKLYHFPYMQLLEACLAVNISGMTLHFIDLCTEYFLQKLSPDGILLSEDRVVQGDLGRLTRKFDVAREKLFYGVSILWQSCVESKPLYPSVLNKVSSATSNLCQIARETVNDLYPYCGLKITETDSEINRVWRDFQTASQHNLLVFGG